MPSGLDPAPTLAIYWQPRVRIQVVRGILPVQTIQPSIARLAPAHSPCGVDALRSEQIIDKTTEAPKIGPERWPCYGFHKLVRLIIQEGYDHHIIYKGY